MSVHRSAGAIFWGLTLMTIGGLLLAHNLGYPIHVWNYVARFWPALLIVWGLLKFVDYFRFRNRADARPLFSGGEVFLLILVICAGAVVTTAANFNSDLGNFIQIGDIDFLDIAGESYSYDQHREQQSVEPNSEIEIVNLFGDVEVRPADTDRIVLDAKKNIRANSKDEADRFDQDFTFSIQGGGSRYRIVSNRDESGFVGTPRRRFRSSLVIQVPKRSMVHVDNRNGRIDVQDLTGNQTILNRYGDIEVRNITGQLTVENRNGGVTVEDVSDSVTITNRYANTTVRNVGGELQVDTRNGSVDVSGVKGAATINNAYAPINVENVQGSLTVTGRNNSIDVQHIEGDIRAESSYQNVNIKDPSGAVNVNFRNGDLLLSFEKVPRKDVAVDARYANVTLELPSSSAFRVDAHTDYGNVETEFEGLSINRSNRQKSINGEFRQGGPRLNIATRNGDIRLQKRG